MNHFGSYFANGVSGLNVVAADEWALDYPEDLTDETTAQIGFYAHPSQTGLTSNNGLPP
jgi:hypothetical protein